MARATAEGGAEILDAGRAHRPGRHYCRSGPFRCPETSHLVKGAGRCLAESFVLVSGADHTSRGRALPSDAVQSGPISAP